jgi:hypothetical protein
LSPGDEFLAGDTEFLSYSFSLSSLEVGLVFEELDEAEVGFGVVEPGGVVGVAGEAGEFGFENIVEVEDGGDGGVVNGRVPEVNRGLVAGFGCGWWHGELAPVLF